MLWTFQFSRSGEVRTRTPSETEGMRQPREFQSCLSEPWCREEGLATRQSRPKSRAPSPALMLMCNYLCA
jgi:hypothetical protein